MSGVEPRVVMILNTMVIRVEEQFRSYYVSGVGKDAIFKKVSLGWFVSFNGSYEALHFGFDKPNLSEGDEMKISFEKVKNVRPIEAA